MDNRFFEKPVLNSPYEYPVRHWELDDDGQPTQRIIEKRRRAKFITPIPKPGNARIQPDNNSICFSMRAKGFPPRSNATTPPRLSMTLRPHVDEWRRLPNPNDWQVTPETARLLQHWRHHKFNNFRPFFCQVEAVETAIWLYRGGTESREDRQKLSRTPCRCQ